MNYALSKHAKKVLAEREIQLEWLERTLREPVLRRPDPDDSSLERRYWWAIPEFEGRVLRVLVNVAIEPVRVVSVFFDRSMRGKL